MRSFTQHSKKQRLYKRVPVLFVLRGRILSKKHVCFLEGAAGNFNGRPFAHVYGLNN